LESRCPAVAFEASVQIHAEVPVQSEAVGDKLALIDINTFSPRPDETGSTRAVIRSRRVDATSVCVTAWLVLDELTFVYIFTGTILGEKVSVLTEAVISTGGVGAEATITADTLLVEALVNVYTTTNRVTPNVTNRALHKRSVLLSAIFDAGNLRVVLMG